MRKVLLFALGLLLALPLVAFAAAGGEGGNVNCSGQGNPNSPCVQGGAGGGGGQGGAGGNGGQGGKGGNGQGGQGGNSDAHSKSKAKATATATAGAAATISAPASQSVKIDAPLIAPNVTAPSLAVGSDVCRGAASFGLSGPMAGLSFGNTYTDDDCQLRAFARSLQSLGYPEAALALLATNPNVAAALRKTGTKASWLEDGKERVAAARMTAPAPLMPIQTTNFSAERSP